jgi:hypothetical protein
MRAGVSSGVGTLTWMAFLPSALAFGFLTKHSGLHSAAWVIVAATAATCICLLRLASTRHAQATTRHARHGTAEGPLLTLASAPQ